MGHFANGRGFEFESSFFFLFFPPVPPISPVFPPFSPEIPPIFPERTFVYAGYRLKKAVCDG